MTAPPEVRELGATIAVLVYEFVVRTIQSAGAQTGTPSASYTTHAPPPGMSRRRFNEVARQIPGALKVGRAWSVTVEDFRAWSQGRTKASAVSAVTTDRTRAARTWSPAAALRDAGARATRARQ